MRVMTIVGLALGVLGCGDVAPAGLDGDARMRVTIASLIGNGAAAVCWDVRVRGAIATVSAFGDPEVGRADGDDDTVCSDRFGSGDGGVALVAPCDARPEADVDPRRDGVQNEVAIWLDGLYAASGAAVGDWFDPCPPEGCRGTFDCEPDVDTEVAFDLTLLRRDTGGFFDILIGIEALYCAAKVDCREPPAGDGDIGAVLHLVSDASGARVPTVVAAFACSAAPGESTWLYASDYVLDCDGDAHDVVVSMGTDGPVFAADPPGFVANALVFQGWENLDPTYERLYWNAAIGLASDDGSDPAAPTFAATSCRLRGRATVANGDLDARAAPNVVATYPSLVVDVPITDETGALVCTQHPLGGGVGFEVEYAPLDALLEALAWEMHTGGAGVVVEAQGAPPGE